MNLWNSIGLIAWVVLLAYLIFIIINIRQRHLKMVVQEHKTRSLKTTLIDIAEVIVLFVAVWGMVWVTWLRPVDFTDKSSVTIKHSYNNLVLKTGDTHSYFVSVRSGNGKNPIRYYTYWTEGARYQISSLNATIADGVDPLTMSASAYPWSKKTLTKMDKITEKAYVATMTATYKDTFLNGLGMHAGKTADHFSLIRIPNETFVQVNPVEDQD